MNSISYFSTIFFSRWNAVLSLHVADCSVLSIFRYWGGARNKKAFMGATPPKTHTKRTSSPLLAMFVVDSFKFSSDLYAGYILLLEPFFTYSNQIEWSRHSPMWTLHLFLCVHSTPFHLIFFFCSVRSLSARTQFTFNCTAARMI